jgi:hypothetical protein
MFICEEVTVVMMKEQLCKVQLNCGEGDRSFRFCFQ